MCPAGGSWDVRFWRGSPPPCGTPPTRATQTVLPSRVSVLYNQALSTTSDPRAINPATSITSFWRRCTPKASPAAEERNFFPSLFFFFPLSWDFSTVARASTVSPAIPGTSLACSSPKVLPETRFPAGAGARQPLGAGSEPARCRGERRFGTSPRSRS